MWCAEVTVIVKIAFWLSVFLEPKPIPWHKFWWDDFCGFFVNFLSFFLFSVVVVVTNCVQLRNSCFQCDVFNSIKRYSTERILFCACIAVHAHALISFKTDNLRLPGQGNKTYVDDSRYPKAHYN